MIGTINVHLSIKTCIELFQSRLMPKFEKYFGSKEVDIN